MGVTHNILWCSSHSSMATSSSSSCAPLPCCLLVLCGIPGTGKTTLAQQLVWRGREQTPDSWCFVHICLDDFYPVDTRAYRYHCYIICILYTTPSHTHTAYAFISLPSACPQICHPPMVADAFCCGKLLWPINFAPNAYYYK